MAPVPNRRVPGWTARTAGLALVLGAALPALVAAQAGRLPQFIRVIGQSGLEVGLSYLNDPAGVAVSPADDGRVFVVDRGNARVVVFDATGNPLGGWGLRGAAKQQFFLPTDIGVSPDGRYVYVLDEGHHQVQRFEPLPECFAAGARDCFGPNKVIAFGLFGTRGDGVLQDPTGLAVDRQGRVFVADAMLHRIVVFDGDGQYLDTFGTPGNEKDELLNPTDVAVHPDGTLWVADTSNDRISFFSPEGEYKGQWKGGGGRGGQLFRPSGIAIDADGSFVVRDFDESFQTSKAGRFGANKSNIWSLSMDGDEPDGTFPFQGAAFLPDGSVLLTDPRAESNVLVQVMPDGRSKPFGGTRGRHPMQYDRPVAVAMDTQLMAIVDADNHRVVVHGRSGADIKFKSVLGLFGSGDFDLRAPAGIAIHRTGEAPDDALIYISDAGAHTVYVARPTGERLARWGDGTARSGQDGLKVPQGIAVAPNGDVYIADTGNNRIVRRAGYPRDAVIGTFPPRPGTGPGELDGPVAVSFGPGERVFVLEANRNRLQAFSPEGEFLGEWKSRADRSGDVELGELWLPKALGTDGKWLYVVESDAPWDHVRIQVFDPRPGVPLLDCFIAKFPRDGPGAGTTQLWDPHGVAADGEGYVAVADSGNNRVMLYQWKDEAVPPTASPTETAQPPSATPTEPPSASPTPSATDTEPATAVATYTATATATATAPPTATEVPASPTPLPSGSPPPTVPTEPTQVTTPTSLPTTPAPTATDTRPANTKPTPKGGKYRVYLPIGGRRFIVGNKLR